MAEKKQEPPKEKNGTQQPAVPSNGFKSKQPSLDAGSLFGDVTIPPGQMEPLSPSVGQKKIGPQTVAPQPDSPITPESQAAAVASDVPSSSPETPFDVAEMDDDALVGYALGECKKRDIRSKAALLKELPDVFVEIMERNLTNMVFMEKEGDGQKEAGSGPTRIDVHAHLPGNELAVLDAAQRKEGQEASQQNPPAAQANGDERISAAPESPPAPSQERPPASSSGGGGPTETDDERWLRQFTEITQDMVKQVGDPNIPVNEAINRAEDFYAAAKEELCSRKKLDSAALEGMYKYFVTKKSVGDSLTALDAAIFELGNLRARIDRYSRRGQSEPQEAPPPAPEFSVKPRPEPIQDAESDERPAFMMKPKSLMVKELSARKKSRSFLAHRMTVAVVATTALSWAMHVRDAFGKAAITLNRLWEEALHLKPIDITAKQVMYAFYGLIGVTTLTWLYRKIQRFRKHRQFFRRLKEGHEHEYEYMIRQLREIRGRSADDEEQSDALLREMVSDENLFYCLNMFNKTPDEATGESGAIKALEKAGLSPGVISNFYMLLGGAEKRIMLARFKELAKSWVPPKVRRNKLRKLCHESPVFTEKLAELFMRDATGNYTREAMTKRSKYEKLPNIEKLSGVEILNTLEQDYVEIRDDLSSGYSI